MRTLVMTLSLAFCVAGATAPAANAAAEPVFALRVRDGVLTTTPADALTVNGEMARPSGDGLLSSAFDELSVPVVPGLRGGETLSVAAWVAPASTPRSYQTILFRGDRSASPQRIHFSLCLFDGIPEFKYMDGAGRWHGLLRNGGLYLRPGRDALPLGELPKVQARRWHHVAATFSAGEVAVYLDGTVIASGSEEQKTLVPCDAPLMLGAGQGVGGRRAYLLPGLINDVLVFNEALSADAVAELYQRQRGAKDAGEVQIPKSSVELAVEHAFETTLPIVESYLDKPIGRALDTSRGVSVDHAARGAVLRIGDTSIYPMAMMPEPYVGDDAVTLSCRDFAAAGVDIYSDIFWSWMAPRDGAHSWWLGPGQYDFERIDARVRAVLAANPRGLFLPRLKLNPPKWWLETHPDHVVRYEDGTPGPQVSLASREWTALYSQLLRDVIGHMEAADYADRIIGYHPAGGGSSEWFWWGHNKGTVDFSPVAVARWRDWLRDTYGNDAALRVAWGDKKATLDAAMPSPAGARDNGVGVFLRLTPAQRAWCDYHRFLSEIVSENIVESCRIAKEACGGRKIAGVFYGYSMYCNNTLGFRGLARVMNSPHVDFLCAPTSYTARRGGDPGNHISAYNGSMRLHSKLYWDEADNRTHLYPGMVGYRTSTLAETLATLRRTVGHSLTRGSGLWYFLLAGNTTFHDQQIMADIARMKAVCDEALACDRAPAAQVAVFVDEEAMNLYDTRHPMTRELGIELLDELACAGAPFDLYLLPDIADPGLRDYRLYVFPNAFRNDEALCEAIRRKVCRNGATVLWVYAPGFADTSGGSVEASEDLTGIRLAALPGGMESASLTLSRDHEITSALRSDLSCSYALAPAFRIDDAAAVCLVEGPLGPALGVREFSDWRSVYSLLPPNRELLLGLYRYAGVHVYCDTFDVIGASRDYLMIHTATSGAKELRLPAACDATELITGRTVGQDIRVIRDELPAGVTRIYRLTYPGR
jgi:hypothetical protein